MFPFWEENRAGAGPGCECDDAAFRFLFLEGRPWFFITGMLRRSGAICWRAGSTAGRSGPLPPTFRGRAEDWPATFAALLDGKSVTDLVLYGDTRPIHARAVEIARARGITVHVFEEGYLRPYWITYERGGANGHSRLIDLSVGDMRRALEKADMDLPDAPARWGARGQHIFWGALYHWFVLTGFRAYRNFRPHRALTVRQEFLLYLRRLA